MLDARRLAAGVVVRGLGNACSARKQVVVVFWGGGGWENTQTFPLLWNQIHMGNSRYSLKRKPNTMHIMRGSAAVLLLLAACATHRADAADPFTCVSVVRPFPPVPTTHPIFIYFLVARLRSGKQTRTDLPHHLCGVCAGTACVRACGGGGGSRLRCAPCCRACAAGWGSYHSSCGCGCGCGCAGACAGVGFDVGARVRVHRCVRGCRPADVCVCGCK